MTQKEKTYNNEPMLESHSSAKKKLLQLLARRDYSEKELIEKLSQQFSHLEIQQTLVWAQKKNLLKSPEELAAKIAEKLNQKLKSIEWINQILQSKGLPLVASDSERELEKARQLIDKKRETSPEKMMRFLFRQGFAPETVGKVIYEKR